MSDAMKRNVVMGRGRGFLGEGRQDSRGIGRGNRLGLLDTVDFDKIDTKSTLPPGSGRGRGINQREDKRKIMIPANYTGCVIGKAGAKIRELKEESGANINIPRDNSGSEVEVELSGTQEQMEKAQDLIEQLTLTGKHKIVVTYRDQNENSSTRANDGGGGFWGSANYGAPAEEKSAVDSEEKEERIDWGAALRECNEAQAEKWAKLPKLVKDFYQEDPTVAALSDEEVRIFRVLY